jgi:hypothetical protein
VDAPSSRTSPTATYADSPSMAPHSVSAAPISVSGVTNGPSTTGVVPTAAKAPKSPAPWPLSSPTVLAPVVTGDTDDTVDIPPTSPSSWPMNNPAVGAPTEFANTDDTVDFPPSQTTPTPVHVFPTSPITAAPNAAPTNAPSKKDSTLEEVCTPTHEDAPRVRDVRFLSKDEVKGRFDISDEDGTVTIELLVRDEKAKAISAIIVVYTGKDEEYRSFTSEKTCGKEIDSNALAILKCDIKLPRKRAPPGTYKIEVCVFGGDKKSRFYSAASLEKNELKFSFEVTNTKFVKL